MKKYRCLRFAARQAKGRDGQPNGNMYIRAIFAPAERSEKEILLDKATNKRVEHALTYWPDAEGIAIWKSLKGDPYKTSDPTQQDMFLINDDFFVINADLFQVPCPPHYRYYPQDVPGDNSKKKGMITHDKGVPRVYTSLSVFATCDPTSGQPEENLEAIAARRIQGIGITVDAYKLKHPDAPVPVIAGFNAPTAGSAPNVGKPTAADVPVF